MSYLSGAYIHLSIHTFRQGLYNLLEKSSRQRGRVTAISRKSWRQEGCRSICRKESLRKWSQYDQLKEGREEGQTKAYIYQHTHRYSQISMGREEN
jgi:hypothetical protein